MRRLHSDFIVGKTLIVEVDGKIHDKESRKTPDRIRHRALENMGYNVLRVRNEEIQATPDAVAERIIQRYFEVADNDDRRPTKITKTKEANGLRSYTKRGKFQSTDLGFII